MSVGASRSRSSSPTPPTYQPPHIDEITDESGYICELFTEKVDEDFICAICRNVLRNPVQLPCEHVYCSFCLRSWISVNRSCPTDRQVFELSDVKPLNRIAKKFYDKMQIKCVFEGCDFSDKVGDFEKHLRLCLKNPNRLSKCLKCTSFIRFSDLESHDCITFLLGKIRSDQANLDPIATATNVHGHTARLGATGKYYCGEEIRFRCCGSCDGCCGPDNGCNCDGCMKLDVTRRNLNQGYLVNAEGATARKGTTGLYYCGRRVLNNHSTNDAYCGPNNGSNCSLCQRLDHSVGHYGICL